MKKFLSAVILTFIFTSCTTVRYRYRADLEIRKKEEYSFTFEKDYSTELDAVLCALTIGFYCLLYLGKPDSNDMDMVDRDGERKLRQLMKRDKIGKYDFEILGSRIDRVGWGWNPFDTTAVLEKKYSD